MPLYSCQRCGWATTDSWRRAVPEHASGSPDCPGTVELVSYSGSGAVRPRLATRRDPQTPVFPHPAPALGGDAA